LKTSCEEQIRRKPEQWAQYHTQKAPLVSSTLPVATQSPTPPSPLFSVDFRTDVRKKGFNHLMLQGQVRRLTSEHSFKLGIAVLDILHWFGGS